MRALGVSLGTICGLQLLRALFPLLVFVLRDRLGLSTIALGLVALALFAPAFGMPRSAARGRPDSALGASLLFVAIARGLLSASRFEPIVSLLIAAAGALAFFRLLAGTGRLPSPSGGLGAAGPVLFGALADVALHALAGTRDLHWGGLRSDSASAVLVAASLAIAWRLRGSPADGAADAAAEDPDTPGRGGRPGGFVWGPWLFLQLEILGNVARQSARSGLATPASGVTVTAGLALALLIAGAVAARTGRRGVVAILAATAALGLGIAGTGLPLAGRGGIAALALAQTGAAVLVARGAGTRSRRPAAFGAGILLFLVLLFTHYAGYDLSIPIGRTGVFALGGVALAAAALAAGVRRVESAPAARPTPPPRTLGLALAAALVAVPLLRPVILPAPPLVEPTAPGEPVDRPLRIVTFNLHDGFDERGGFAVDRMLRELARTEADVIALQEVSRGWVVNGSADLHELARERLGYHGVAGPSSHLDWGNAIFSRRKPGASRLRPLPPSDLPLPRAVLEVEVPGPGPDGGAIRVFATHLHHREADEDIREVQTRFLAEALPPAGPAILLGDFNAGPTAPSRAILAAADWRDVQPSDLPTAATYPSRAPVRRIDTILVRGDLAAVSVRVVPPWGSDHRGVIAEIRQDRPEDQALSRPGR